MGLYLLIPFFLVRFGLLGLVNKEAIKRAAYFAPLKEGERAAYYLYQLSNLGVFAVIIFGKVKLTPPWLFYLGLLMYFFGISLLALSVVSFAKPSESGVNTKGIYKFSRNPMYVAYFVVFMGCVCLLQSFLLLGFLLVFQISSHWIILSEERWCVAQFGSEYTEYMKRVRRYL